MLKSLKALLLGYVLFDINGERFFFYHRASERLDWLIDSPMPEIHFTGLNIFRLPLALLRADSEEAWRAFYWRWRRGGEVYY